MSYSCFLSLKEKKCVQEYFHNMVSSLRQSLCNFTLAWFGTKIAQKHAKRIKNKSMKYSAFHRHEKRHFLTFSTSGQRQVTTCCACAVTSRKKSDVSGCCRQAGGLCCFRCLLTQKRRLVFPDWDQPAVYVLCLQISGPCRDVHGPWMIQFAPNHLHAFV